MNPSTQISDAVTWTVTNRTSQPQEANCQVLVLNGSTQIGDYGPVQFTVAAKATAEEFSQVETLSGSSAGDTAQIACQKG